MHLAGDGDNKIGLKGNGDANGMTVSMNHDINSHGVSTVAPLLEKKNEEEEVSEDVKLNLFPKGEEPIGRGDREHVDCERIELCSSNCLQ